MLQLSQMNQFRVHLCLDLASVLYFLQVFRTTLRVCSLSLIRATFLAHLILMFLIMRPKIFQSRSFSSKLSPASSCFLSCTSERSPKHCLLKRTDKTRTACDTCNIRSKNISYLWIRGTQWRSWLRHCATSRKAAGSIPDVVIDNHSGRTLVLRSTKPLTEMSTRNISRG
jgi:hypothetical protein